MEALNLRHEPESEDRPVSQRGCLAAGCTCKDVRFLSRRRAMFHAYLARARGEIAGRVIEPEPDWVLPLTA